MGRILAIDYGLKRTGIAVTDPLRIIANGLDTVLTSDLLTFLKKYVASENVDLFVVGLPYTVQNEPSETMKYIEPFIARLKKEIPHIPVELVDERFTSKLAKQTILLAGAKKKKRQDKALVDKVSAVIILQSYLESKKYNL